MLTSPHNPGLKVIVIFIANRLLFEVTDNSGIRVLYTDQLRENDGGVIAVGHKISPFQTVPPSMPSFTAMGYCVSECTSQVSLII